MNIVHTSIEGCFILEPKIINDGRGYFYESYNKQTFKQVTGLDVDFVQDNQSFSSKGVLRGLHYQIGDAAQAKLVRVIQGEVLDVAVDLRADSATFGKYVSAILSADNKRQMFVPKGFAHGFLVMSDVAEFAYKCDNYYNREQERGIRYNDPALSIDWGFAAEAVIVSEKDQLLPFFSEAEY